jgi:hypothetical protein
MKPQVKVIADFPGNKDFELGKVIEFEPWNESYWQYKVEDCQGERVYLLEFFERYPYLFEIVGKEKQQPTPAACWVNYVEGQKIEPRKHYPCKVENKINADVHLMIVYRADENWDLPYPFIVRQYLDESISLPTREQAEKWADKKAGEDITANNAALAMYDWIISKTK